MSEYTEDGAYFCYCTYVLRISRYSAFLWVVPTNTWIFLRSLKLCAENRTIGKAGKLGVTMHFSEITKLQFEKKPAYIALYFTVFFFLEIFVA